jgi:hypothetical protein
MKNSNNPIVQDVINRFDGIRKVSSIFVTGLSSQKGLIISGDAGTGKSYYVQKAFEDTNTTDRIDYNKSKSFTAASFYVRLWLNKNEGDVVVFDDCNIEGLSGNDKKNIIDMLKGATEMTKGERMIGWERAAVNQLMRDLGAPSEFDFQGSIIWITNSSFPALERWAGLHWEALESRFILRRIELNDQEKLMYTLHLLEEVGMLEGDVCQVREGGYPEEIVTATIKYIRDNYKSMRNITARVAAKVADTMYHFPNEWEMLLEHQLT